MTMVFPGWAYSLWNNHNIFIFGASIGGLNGGAQSIWCHHSCLAWIFM